MTGKDSLGGRYPVTYTELAAYDGITIRVVCRLGSCRATQDALARGRPRPERRRVERERAWRVDLVGLRVDDPVGGRLTGTFGHSPLPLETPAGSVGVRYLGNRVPHRGCPSAAGHRQHLRGDGSAQRTSARRHPGRVRQTNAAAPEALGDRDTAAGGAAPLSGLFSAEHGLCGRAVAGHSRAPGKHYASGSARSALPRIGAPTAIQDAREDCIIVGLVATCATRSSTASYSSADDR